MAGFDYGHPSEQAPVEADVYKGECEPDAKASAAPAPETEEMARDEDPALPGRTVTGGVQLEDGEWRTGLFDCCKTDEDTAICLFGTFLPCVLYANTVARLHPSDPNRECSACGAFLGLQLASCTCDSCGCSGIPFVSLLTWRTRAHIRNHFKLKGYARYLTGLMNQLMCSEPSEEALGEDCQKITDFCIHYHCLPCALCQEAREVRRRLPAGVPKAQYPLHAPTEQHPLTK